jgi:hypothetical protein
MSKWRPQDVLFFCFLLLDSSHDGIIDEDDCLSILACSRNASLIEGDFVRISRYVVNLYEKQQN